MRFLSAFARLNSGKVGFISRTIKLLLIIFLTVLTLTTCLSKTTFAQTTSQNANPVTEKMSTGLEPGVPLTARNWTQTIMLNVMSAMSCQLAGIDPSNPSGKCLGVNPKTGKMGYIQGNGGVPVFLGYMITVLFTPPVQVSDYTRYLSQNFGIVKPTFAQTGGTGFIQLNPVVGLWVKMRNISYLLFVFIFVVVGIAIMLRLKIDPRTVMTIQNQIPKLIIGLILITFSYAIAGFLVDIMWVSTYTVANVIGGADPNFSTYIAKPAPVFVNNYMGGGGMFNIATDASGQVTNLLRDMFASYTNPITEAADANGGKPPTNDQKPCTDFPPFCFISGVADVGARVINSIGDLIGSVAGSFFGFIGSIVSIVVGVIVGMLAFLIIIIAIIWSLFRLWFQLLRCFIFILIDVIFAPFWIIAGLIPGVGSSMGFGAWMKDLAGNLAVFPAIVALFSIAKTLLGSTGAYGTTGFSPPGIGEPSNTGLMTIIALGIILASPSVADAVKKAFKAPGIGLSMPGLGIGVAAGSAVGGAIMSRMYYRNPQTGQTGGLAVNVGRNIGRSATHSRPAGFISNRIVTPVTNVVQKVPGAKTAGKIASKTAGVFKDQRSREEKAQAVKFVGGSNPSGGTNDGGTSAPLPPAGGDSGPKTS